MTSIGSKKRFGTSGRTLPQTQGTHGNQWASTTLKHGMTFPLVNLGDPTLGVGQQ